MKKRLYKGKLRTEKEIAELEKLYKAAITEYEKNVDDFVKNAVAHHVRARNAQRRNSYRGETDT